MTLFPEHLLYAAYNLKYIPLKEVYFDLPCPMLVFPARKFPQNLGLRFYSLS